MVMSEAKRFNFLCAGRRWFKSTLLSDLCVRAALDGKNVFIEGHVEPPHSGRQSGFR